MSKHRTRKCHNARSSKKLKRICNHQSINLHQNTKPRQSILQQAKALHYEFSRLMTPRWSKKSSTRQQMHMARLNSRMLKSKVSDLFVLFHPIFTKFLILSLDPVLAKKSGQKEVPKNWPIPKLNQANPEVKKAILPTKNSRNRRIQSLANL